MKKRRRRYYDSYDSLKSRQWKMRKKGRRAHDWEVEDSYLNTASGVVNRKRRSRVGHVERTNDS